MELEYITELFDRKVVVSCYCDERTAKFNPCSEDDNEFWWCDVHDFQGIVLCDGQPRRVKYIDEETGEFIL